MKILVTKGWWRRHWLVVTLPVTLILLSAGALYTYNQSVKAVIEQQSQQAQAAFAADDKQIAALKLLRDAKPALNQDAVTQPAPQPAAQPAPVAASSAAATVCHNGLSKHGDPSSIDVIVNKSHCINPINYAPADLTSIDGYLVSEKIAPHLRDMMAAAADNNTPFGLTSSYRSYSNQVTTYDSWVRVNGSTALADTVSARPGYSEHQTGFAVDLDAGSCVLECFATTAQYEWLQQHAAEYGFIQRYYDGFQTITGYSPEAWHYRYVGTAVATDMKAKGIKTLEQYWGISGGDYVN